MCSGDPLNFKDSLTYPERIQANRAKSGLSEAVISGEAVVNGFPVILTVMDFFFMGGSMGSVVGEKIARAAETALEKESR